MRLRRARQPHLLASGSGGSPQWARLTNQFSSEQESEGNYLLVQQGPLRYLRLLPGPELLRQTLITEIETKECEHTTPADTRLFTKKFLISGNPFRDVRLVAANENLASRFSMVKVTWFTHLILNPKAHNAGEIPALSIRR